jgi:hypothetical protein
MEKIRVRKLYNNRAEIRDYVVDKLIEDKKSLQITFDEEVMTLSPESLVSKRTSVSKMFISKLGKRNYKLYGYDWNPDEIEL